jgi:hypothetical protein
MPDTVHDPVSGIAIRFLRQFDLVHSTPLSKMDVLIALGDDDIAHLFGAPCYPSGLDC